MRMKRKSSCTETTALSTSDTSKRRSGLDVMRRRRGRFQPLLRERSASRPALGGPVRRAAGRSSPIWCVGGTPGGAPVVVVLLPLPSSIYGVHPTPPSGLTSPRPLPPPPIHALPRWLLMMNSPRPLTRFEPCVFQWHSTKSLFLRSSLEDWG